jgi:hypothetical protein
MKTTFRDQALGELRWIVLTGPGPEAFRALGEHMRAEVAGFLATSKLLPQLQRHVAAEPGRQRLTAVRAASQARFPGEWAELAALAEGAGASLDDLALLNFRGDLGVIEQKKDDDGTGRGDQEPGSKGAASGEASGADDGRSGRDGQPTSRAEDATGCSDIIWRRKSSAIAHNEDGAPEEAGRCMLLTLAFDDEPVVTALWYPVFLPSNALTVTADGLVWTIDGLSVAAPGPGAGRHFVGRGLQRTARTIDDAVGYLRAHPSAGGFAYNIGDRDGRVFSIDVAAGQLGGAEIEPAGQPGPLAWHTNHPRYLSGDNCPVSSNSIQRGDILGAVELPEDEPEACWFLRPLAGAPMPRGVRVDPSKGLGGATLCTFVADLTAGEAVMLPRGAGAVAIPLADLAAGIAGRQRPVAFQPEPPEAELT